MKHLGHRTAAWLALTLALGTGACIDEEPTPITGPDFSVVGLDAGPAEDFRVYTQNMWLGGDTGPLFTLPFGDLGHPDPAVRHQALLQIIQATATFRAQVEESDIPARAAEIVDEIEAGLPHVVALQEAVGYATGSLNLATSPPQFTPTAAGPDLLGAVMTEIGARGLPYQLKTMQNPDGKGLVLDGTSIALPIGAPDASFVAPALGVQDRVVMLVRDDVELADWDRRLYQARIPLGPADVVRGFVRVTLEANDMPYHFVATHLETQGSGPTDPVRQIHNAQADELQAITTALEGNVVLMGDLNSDANAGPTARSWTPTYGKLTDAGFIDVWAKAPHSDDDDGVTCCFAPGRTPEERIDFVLLRPDASLATRDDGDHRGFYRADIVGDETSDQTAEGLWPSDHAGIIADISEPTVMR